MSDLIKSPKHYTWHPDGIEPRHVARYLPYNVGTALAYLWRHQHKGTPIEDLQKAVDHLQDEIARLRGETGPDVGAEKSGPVATDTHTHGSNTDAGDEASGWVEWTGGGCPVGCSCLVKIQFRNGKEFLIRAGYVSWLHDDCESDIIAYKVVTPGHPHSPDRRALTSRCAVTPGACLASSRNGLPASFTAFRMRHAAAPMCSNVSVSASSLHTGWVVGSEKSRDSSPRPSRSVVARTAARLRNSGRRLFEFAGIKEVRQPLSWPRLILAERQRAGEAENMNWRPVCLSTRANVDRKGDKVLSKSDKSLSKNDRRNGAMSSVEEAQNLMKEAWPLTRYGSVKAVLYECQRFMNRRTDRAFTHRRARTIWEGRACRISSDEMDALREALIEEAKHEQKLLRARLDALDAFLAARMATEDRRTMAQDR